MRRSIALRGVGVLLLVLLALASLTLRVPPASDAANTDGAEIAPLLPEDAAHGREEVKRWRAERESASARARRERSRTKYRGQSAADALATVRERFAPAVEDEPSLLPGLAASERLGRFSSDTAVEVTDGERSVLVESLLPMRTRDRLGRKVPVQLSLEERADGYAPESPLVEVELGKRLEDGMRFSASGIAVTPRGAQPSSPAEHVRGRLFWANADVDTDVAVAPTALGLETLHFLRSSASPEELVLDFDLPAGAALVQRRIESGGRPVFEVVRDGRTLALVSSPAAIDASYAPVATRASIKGDSLVISVPHRAADLEYPIAVDPEVDGAIFDDYAWATTATGTTGWQRSDMTGKFSLAFGDRTSCGGTSGHTAKFSSDWGRGLWICSRSGTSYGANDFAQWLLRPFGFETTIYKAKFSRMNHEPASSSYVAGLWSDSKVKWESEPLDYPNAMMGWATTKCARTPCADPLDAVAGGPTWEQQRANPDAHIGTAYNVMVFRLAKYGGTGPAGTGWLGNAHVYQWDPVAPKVTDSTWTGAERIEHYEGTSTTPSTTATGRWHRGLALAARTWVSDGGLGLRELALRRETTEGTAAVGPALALCDLPANPDNRRQAPCGPTAERRLAYHTDDLPEGVNRLSARVADYSQNAKSSQAWTVKVDRTSPLKPVISSTATQPLSPGRKVRVATADVVDAAPPTGQAGIQDVQLFVDGSPTGPPQPNPNCTSSGCPATWEPEFELDTARYSEGIHELKAVVRDAAGNDAQSEVIDIYVADLAAVDRAKLGLEDYLQYHSTHTGAGSRLHVNAATGNVVWHSTPIVNPGRGLSSVLNLTYNSHDRGGLLSSLLRHDGTAIVSPELPDLVGLAYGEAGHGFSVGVSGLTRLNEPLAGVATASLTGRVVMTDPDGTAHTFTDADRDGVFTEPPGVHLRLRRFSDTDAAKRWAITRPDGVTFYFDADGFATTIQDRNGNVMRFDYEHYSKVTGDPCTPVAGVVDPKVLCAKRVVAVVDPYGVEHDDRRAERSLKIAYHSGGVLPVGSNPGELPGELLTIGGAPGRIKAITDHANRTTEFAYRDGYLVRLTQGVVGTDRSQARSVELDYTSGDSDTGYPGDDPNRHLQAVRDPNGATTAVQYDPAPAPGLRGVRSFGREVADVTDRRHESTDTPSSTYDFAPRSGAAGTTMTVRDAIARDWTYHVDALARPEELVDPAGTRTVLRWDSDNNVDRLTDAAGTGDEAVTEMSYNAHGQLTGQTDAEQRETKLSYRSSSGTQRATAVADAGAAFVSDLERITPPRGNFTEFGLDDAGNVVSRQVKDQPAARTAYGAYGLITDEWDEVNNHTAFCATSPCASSDFDEHGMPFVRRDERGKLWAYEYDDVGNVKRAIDPRGVATAGDPDDYATVLDYDVFDRLKRTVTPKLSSAGQFVTRRFTYDDNGNALSAEDGTGATRHTAYTAMDEPRREESPAVAHHGEDEAAREVTVLDYDDVGRLRKRTEPNGERTEAEDDYATTYRYDAVDRLIVTTRHNASPAEGTQAALVTSMAYDRRGNVVGVVDAAGNVSGDPVENASDPARRRFTYTYDKTDNRRVAVEDPAGLNLTTEFLYDANENVEQEVAPRGFAEDARADFTTTYGRDTNDLITSVTSGARTTTYDRRGDGRITAKVAPKGNATAGAGDYTTRYDYYATGELLSWTLPDDEAQYGRTSVRVEYGRNDVGDPVTITDARGREFSNTFFDTGQLRTTGRPSWWKFTGDGEAGAGSDGEGADLDPLVGNAARTGGEIQERLPSEWLSDDGGGELPSGEGNGDFGAVERQPLPGILPRAGATSFDYDAEMRLSAVTDTASQTTSLGRDAVGRIVRRGQPFDDGRPIVTAYSFDRNGNLRETVDGEGEATRLEYDQFDRVLVEDAPGALAAAPDPSAPPAAPPRERTVHRYDPNGNALEVVSARGLTTSMTYDEADRLRSETDPEGAVTRIDYDAHGNRTLERRPLGNVNPVPDDRYATRFTYDAFDQRLTETDGLGNTTSFEYDLNGNETRVTEPGAAPAPDGQPGSSVITRAYDGRDRLWKETLHSDQHRTTITEHDPHGNLRRVVKPAGVIEGASPTPNAADAAHQDGAPTGAASRNATVYAYSDDNLRTAEWLPTGDRDDEDRVSYQRTFTHDARGRMEAIEAPFAAGRQRTTRTTYTHYETGWIRSQTDHRYPLTGGDAVAELHFTYDYDRRGDQTAWRTAESGRELLRTYYPNGMLRTRTARSAEDPERQYSYGYSPTRQMAQMVDWHLNRTTSVRRDGADRPLAVDETWGGGGDTVFRYDRDGNVVHQWTDGEYRGDFDDGMPNFAGGKRTSFEYDPLDRETRTGVSQSGQDHERVTTSAYWPSGALRERTKPNGTVEAFGYFGDGSVALRRRDPRAEGEPTEDTAYEYDRNGNRSRDERGDHTYNSRDQLVRWQQPAGAEVPTLDVLYEYNGSGAVTRKTENGTTTEYVMEGDRLVEERVGTTPLQRYGHDLDGNVERIERLFAGSTTYEYDGFGRMVLAHGLETEGVRIHYGYDGLDRRDFFCRNPASTAGDCEDGTRYDLRYVGMTESLSRERPTDAARSIATYDYDSSGERLGEDTMPSDDPAAGVYSAFDSDANGSTVGLEDADGTITRGGANSSAYDLDPFGETRNEAQLGTTARNNPFRFQGFYYDSGIQAYDMQARPYRPDIGRFLTADRFESALGDFNLQSDPLTQNRYAFAGGNPVNNIEWDGHQLANKYEAKYCTKQKSRLEACALMWRASLIADRAARRIFGDDGGKGDSRANAFRHAFWNALMEHYAYAFLALDDGHVRHFAYLHERPELESGDPTRVREARVDLHNNALGRGVARRRDFADLEQDMCEIVLKDVLARSRKLRPGKKGHRHRYWYTGPKGRLRRRSACRDKDLADVEDLLKAELARHLKQQWDRVAGSSGSGGSGGSS